MATMTAPRPLIPLMMGGGESEKEIQAPLAVALLGGLISSTRHTMVVSPRSILGTVPRPATGSQSGAAGRNSFAGSRSSMSPHPIQCTPRAVASSLGVVAFLLLLASAGSQILAHATGISPAHGVVRFFDLNSEFNLPTFYASGLLSFAAVLLAVIAVLERQLGRSGVIHWATLSAGFLVMALDESATLHERLAPPLRQYFGEHLAEVFHFAWVLPGIVLVLLLGLGFLPFVMRLPGRTRLAFVAAAIIFLGGALGVELLEGYLYAQAGRLTAVYSAVATAQEVLEMGGVILFIWALLDYLGVHHGALHLSFRSPSADHPNH